jgi:hypothetical protein
MLTIIAASCAIATTLPHRIAPCLAKDIVAKSGSIVFVTPTNDPFVVQVEDVIHSKTVKQGLLRLHKPDPVLLEPSDPFVGVFSPTVLFLKDQAEPPNSKYSLADYYYGWIPISTRTFPYSRSTSARYTGRPIKLIRVGKLLFLDKFKPRNAYVVTRKELFRELARISKAISAKSQAEWFRR